MTPGQEDAGKVNMAQTNYALEANVKTTSDPVGNYSYTFVKLLYTIVSKALLIEQ